MGGNKETSKALTLFFSEKGPLLSPFQHYAGLLWYPFQIMVHCYEQIGYKHKDDDSNKNNKRKKTLDIETNDLYLARIWCRPRGLIRHNFVVSSAAQSQPGPSYTGNPMHNSSDGNRLK